MFNEDYKINYTVMWGEDNNRQAEDFNTKLQAFKFAIKLADKGKKGIFIDEFKDGESGRDIINYYKIIKN